MNEIVKHTKDGFIKKFTSKESLNVSTALDAMKSDKNTIAFYRREIGIETILLTIKAHLTLVVNSINVHQNLNAYQIEEITNEINQKYYFLNMTEIAFIFKRARTGYYGSFQYSIDMPIVLSWFEKYTDERVKISMEEQRKEHQQIKSGVEVRDGKIFNTDSKVFNDLQMEVLTKFKGELTDKERKEAEFKKFREEYNKKNNY